MGESEQAPARTSEDHESRLVIYSFQDAGVSIANMAVEMQQEFQQLGYRAEVDVSGSNKEFSHAHILSLREHMTAKIMAARRWTHIRSYTTMHTRAIYELSVPEWIGMMANFAKEKVAKRPIRMVAHSPYIHDRINARCREYFSPSWHRMISGNVPLIPYGVSRAFQYVEQTHERELFVCPFNRVKGGVDMKDHANITKQVKLALTMKGHETVHLFRHAPGYAPDTTQSLYDVYRVEEQPTTRVGYIQECRRYGMAISTSRSESFGIYFLELLFSGVPVVFLDAPWVRQLLPNYKLVAPLSKLAEMALGVFHQYENTQQYLKQEVVPELERMYRLTRFVEGLVQLIGPSFEECRASKSC